MFVSILQLVSSCFGNPGAERPIEKPSRGCPVPDNQGITRIDEGHALPKRGRSAAVRQPRAEAAVARRQEVKPQPKTGKSAAKTKPASKPVKSTAKPAARKPAKKAAPPRKAAPAKKPAPAKASAKKAAAKPPAKKTPAKAAKPAPKKIAVPAKGKPAAKAAPAKPKTAAAKTLPKGKSPAGAALPRAMPPRPDAAALGAEPARATKPSARLAQITVPSMAQSVASTAAKASYIQTMAPSVLPPPPLVAVKKDPKLANNWKTKAVEQLSDAEVLAMPDSEYMNEKQMAFFRLKLTQLKQEILNSAGETTEHLREDTVIVPDPADRATIEEEHALELRTRDRERKLLKKIEQSIARIDAGDYGYCDETGEPIGVGRLLARPTATLSLEAQQRRELKQKMFGD
jgi:DnaK suppressor protein